VGVGYHQTEFILTPSLVFFSYAVVTVDEVILFIADGQLTEDALQYLGDQVRIKPYNTFFDNLKELPSTLDLNDKSVSAFDRRVTSVSCINEKIILGEKASLAIADAIGEGKYTTEISPVNELKAVKNDVELEGFRQCHIRDGVALARYFAWLEEQLTNGVELNESQGADQLEKYRS
jgi:Xaa-Pro aminopeptidase